MMAAKLAAAKAPSRRQRLEQWQKDTGRTPMKRFSYVMPCQSRPQTDRKRVWSRLQSGAGRLALAPSSNLLRSEQPARHRPQTAVQDENADRSRLGKPSRRMVTPLQKKSYNRRHTFTAMAGEGLGGASPSDSPPSALGEVARPERRGMGGSGGGGGGGDPLVLQLDYLNAVANEEREEGEGGGDAGSSPGVVEVSSASVCKGKMPRRSVRFDEEHIFASSAIRFTMALSEPRRLRGRGRESLPVPPLPPRTPRSSLRFTPRSPRSTLRLTPVRRSTRSHRNGPGLALDRALCFVSPSEARALEEFEEVEVVPNTALLS